MSDSRSVAAVILAAGQGTRLKSAVPKVLQPLGGRPLVEYAIEAAEAVTGQPPVLVVAPEAEAVRAAAEGRVRFAEQAQALGTAHAVQQAGGLLAGQADLVLVIYADMPLLRGETLRALVAAQRANPGPLTALTAHSARLRDFGRVVRGSDGAVLAVVEAAQATTEQLALTEVNVGAYCFDAAWLWAALPRLPLSPKGEYYLTDALGLAASEGGRVATVTTADEDEASGVNTRTQLAQAEAALRRRINAGWLEAGVSLLDPAATYIEPGVRLGSDTVILPNTHLQGQTVIGGGCVIGPNTIIRDSVVGDNCRIECSVLEGATLSDEVSIGPFARLRPGARLERGVHLGNFGEVKNATLGPGVKMGHFSYIGDADIGAETNIGAGTITANYDGERKNHSTIGAGVFLGSDTVLVPPLTVGDGARTGAGAVVTKDVPPDTLAVGVPARVIRKLKST